MGDKLTPDEIAEIQESEGVITLRGWGQVKTLLKLDSYEDSHWKGKEILDVGSGLKPNSPKKAFPDATVYAIDPAFELEDGEFYLQKRVEDFTAAEGESEELNNTYALPTTKIEYESNTAHEKKIAIASNIPYPTNKFDVVMSTIALLYEKKFFQAVLELIRVTKPGGEIRMSPIPSELEGGSFVTPLINKAGFKVETLGEGIDVLVIKVPEMSNEEKNEHWNRLKADFLAENLISVKYVKK